MYAIVEIAGQQFKVEAGKTIFVHRLEAEEGQKVDFNHVLLVEEDGEITIGEPAIEGAIIEGKVLSHLRGDKVIVFKKKRKKGYRIKNGHRQNFTEVEIISINGKEAPKKAVPKKAAVKEAAETSEEPVKEKKAAAKKPADAKAKAEKSADEKKPAAKKTASKKASETKE
jgi:large subunit ribosomal protein L21